jgi:hypothetical protein
MLSWLARQEEWPTTYRVDDDEAPLPVTFDEAFLARAGGDHTALLSIDLAGAAVNCHFWSDWEIELDIAAREFQTDDRLEALVEFARAAASAVGRPIYLTEDNERDWVFAMVRPDGHVEPVPPSSESGMPREFGGRQFWR